MTPRRLLAAALALPLAAHAADFTGIWQPLHPTQPLRPDGGGAPPLTPQAAALYRTRTPATRAAWDPALHCKPLGIPRALLQSGWPFEWAQSPARIDQLFQWNRLDRTIMVSDHLVTTSDTVQDSGGPYYLGAAYGHWDNDSFVVHTQDQDGATQLDPSGLPHSDAMTLDERYTLSKDGQTLTDHILITDPATYTHPWTTTLTFKRAPKGTEIAEDACIDRLHLNSFAITDNSLNR